MRSNFLEIFQFLWFLNFSIHSKTEHEVRSTKQVQNKLEKKHAKMKKNISEQPIKVITYKKN